LFPSSNGPTRSPISTIASPVRSGGAADSGLAALSRELRAYPCDEPEVVVDATGTGDVFVPLRIRHDGRTLHFFSTTIVFGTPLDITLAELAIEAFFPADPDTAVLRDDGAPRRGGASGPGGP